MEQQVRLLKGFKNQRMHENHNGPVSPQPVTYGKAVIDSRPLQPPAPHVTEMLDSRPLQHLSAKDGPQLVANAPLGMAPPNGEQGSENEETDAMRIWKRDQAVLSDLMARRAKQ